MCKKPIWIFYHFRAIFFPKACAIHIYCGSSIRCKYTLPSTWVQTNVTKCVSYFYSLVTSVIIMTECIILENKVKGSNTVYAGSLWRSRLMYCQLQYLYQVQVGRCKTKFIVVVNYFKNKKVMLKYIYRNVLFILKL